ncbi:putative deacylase [Paenibacillus sp. RC73]|uniref:succinylglutamate desuccinylase/aspartoacylase domain-containing protein n=1 Tax=Paenibacillus sp. RC73 TaxID=3156250 RepID=UPI0038346BB6
MFQPAHVLKYASIEEALSSQPRKSVAKIDDTYQDVPAIFFLIKGYEEGPTVWIQAALHGDEYDGIVACIHLIEHLDVNCLKGNIIVCPITNPSAFQAGTNESPLDGVNLNRVFQQERTDTYSYRYGEWLAQKITSWAHFFIDLHGGGKYLDVCPFAMVASDQTLAYEAALAALKAVNLTAIYTCESRAKGMLINEVCKYGIPAVLLESGGGSHWTEEGVAAHQQSLYAILAELHILAGTPASVVGKGDAHRVTKIEELRFEASGLQRFRASAGDEVKLGDPLIEVLSFPEYETHRIICPVDHAVILSIHTASVVHQHDYAVMLGIIE